jgi:cell division septation protein DedD
VQVASIDRKATRATTTGRTAEAKGRFCVRLGPYASRKAAETARNRLAKAGYRARVVGQALMLGDFAERSGADKLAKGLRGKGYRPMVTAAR